LTRDFQVRDALAQSDAPQAMWYSHFKQEGWGPNAATYPQVTAPPDCDAQGWKRARVLAVAKKYLGLPYRHHHIPAWSPPGVGAGLDCSNFTAWVYNYALGMRFTSNITLQALGAGAPGRRLDHDERLAPGDLIFLYRKDYSSISHVALYLENGFVIDAHNCAWTGQGVRIREIRGWYASHQAFARRVIE
jgi:cell wall-associated NlpC family hydrolase